MNEFFIVRIEKKYALFSMIKNAFCQTIPGRIEYVCCCMRYIRKLFYGPGAGENYIIAIFTVSVVSVFISMLEVTDAGVVQ